LESNRSDKQEIKKIISKKRSKYPDEHKFMAYLARLGFNYDDIREALQDS
jgi:regulatory protein